MTTSKATRNTWLAWGGHDAPKQGAIAYYQPKGGVSHVQTESPAGIVTDCRRRCGGLEVLVQTGGPKACPAPPRGEYTGVSPGFTSPPEGRKDDEGKPQYSLLPWDAVEQVVRVLEHGATKYGADNWRKVPNARKRYVNAAFRHLVAVARGEWLDKESGLPHAAHAACCLLFLLAGREDRNPSDRAVALGMAAAKPVTKGQVVFEGDVVDAAVSAADKACAQPIGAPDIRATVNAVRATYGLPPVETIIEVTRPGREFYRWTGRYPVVGEYVYPTDRDRVTTTRHDKARASRVDAAGAWRDRWPAIGRVIRADELHVEVGPL